MHKKDIYVHLNSELDSPSLAGVLLLTKENWDELSYTADNNIYIAESETPSNFNHWYGDFW